LPFQKPVRDDSMGLWKESAGEEIFLKPLVAVPHVFRPAWLENIHRDGPAAPPWILFIRFGLFPSAEKRPEPLAFFREDVGQILTIP